MPRSDHQFVVRRGDSSGEEYRVHDKETKFSAAFLIILVSLLFVSVLGGALVGGVVSGNPSNEFFIAILCASGVAIGAAVIVGLRYWCKQRVARKERGKAVKHRGKRDIRGDIRGTITRTADEDEEAGYYDNRGRFYPTHGDVKEKIEEVEAQSMAPGDISAMSPGTYDHYSYAQSKSQGTRSEYNGNGYRLRVNLREQEEFRPTSFDFESVTSKQSLPIREDPPEDFGCNAYAGIPVSKDPAAAIVRADGTMIFDEAPEDDLDPYSPVAMSQASRSTRSRYYVEDDEEATAVATTDEERRDEEFESTDKKKRERSKSPDKNRKSKVGTYDTLFMQHINISDQFPPYRTSLLLLLRHQHHHAGQRFQEVHQRQVRLEVL